MAQPGRARDSYGIFREIPMPWVQIPLDPPNDQNRMIYLKNYNLIAGVSFLENL